MKVDKGVSTWRIWGFYIQCFKELTFAKSKSTGNNCPLTTIASSSPTRTNVYIYICVCVCVCVCVCISNHEYTSIRYITCI